MSRLRIRSRRGFSLVELMVVAVIIMAIAAILLPKIVTVLSDYNLKSAMGQAAGMLQQQRMQAVRLNSTLQVSTGTQNGRTIAWVNIPGGTSNWDSGEPFIEFPKNITVQNSSFPGDATSGLGYTAQTPSTAVVKFNARGLPCVIPSGGTLCANYDGTRQVGFVLYFRNSGSYGIPGWGAITIAPGGRIRSWFYNGSYYSPM
jgi:type II secretory pathway pseudopilin PulG